MLQNALYNFPDPGPAYAYRGVPRHGKAILVNIPSFELIAFENGQPVLRSRVIVGKPSTPTPIMLTETSVVRFRPTWTPTPRMIRSGKYRPGTRPPGKRNPLGFLAIRLAPGMLIYLHGTNKPQLYDRDKRALSHGCVRVEKWDEVAAWVLGTSVDDVHAHAYGRRTFDAQTDGIPVIMSYQLRFPDTNGVIRNWDDVYRRGTETVLARTL
ncbi:MAG: L,D-transpeptidase family protein [Pseudomonadota bacterium]